MALSRALAMAVTGVDGRVVEVECDMSAGLPGLSFTGLADTAVVESRDRVRAALVNSGIAWPNRRVTIALFPADLRKVGSRFDLAVAVAVLAAARHVPTGAVSGAVWIAELGLDGRLRPVRGVLPAVLAARSAGIGRVVVSAANADEAALVHDVDVRCARTLTEVVDWLTGSGPPLPSARGAGTTDPIGSPDPLDAVLDAPDLADVVGQPDARHALEIAAAGGHHLFLIGPPGAGKTMLAERLPGILPPLTDEESLEVTAVQSVAGLLAERVHLVRRPPFQAPHHTASTAALVGGGSHLARPGAISRAHRGVLFLDEVSEFSSRTLDALRQPIESGTVTLSRGGGSVTYPARFQLVLAANPCACATPGLDCVCAPPVRRRHAQRLSGPLMDRIDLRLAVAPVASCDLTRAGSAGPAESSAAVAARVAAARAAALGRWAGTPWRCNAELPGAVLRSPDWAPPDTALRPLVAQLDRGGLSARGFDRVLRVAWTLADLGGRAAPAPEDVAIALFFRAGPSAAAVAA